jgi:hypothetical protein
MEVQVKASGISSFARDFIDLKDHGGTSTFIYQTLAPALLGAWRGVASRKLTG